MTAPVLAVPQFGPTDTFVLEMDASNMAIGAVFE